MKCRVPEISWHNRDPVYTVDIQPKINKNEKFYRLASGGADSHVVIWHIVHNEKEDKDSAVIEFAADLDRHVKPVNVVRFANDSESLASGGDDGIIIIWKLKKEQSLIEPSTTAKDEKESWISWKVLKGHLEDVYDLSWSFDCTKIISGSVDNSAILWDVNKGRSLGPVGDHKGFVQGVAWDPKDEYLATLCTDRTLRIIKLHNRRTLCKVTKSKCAIGNNTDQKSDEKFTKLFHDDTLKTFFRRLCFSPDGEILITPSGVMEDPNVEGKSIDVSYIFTRCSITQPVLHLPSPGQYTVAARCCPTLFQLRDFASNVFDLPYRIIFAIATKSTVVFYDTQQPQPFAYVSNIHYTGLTDLSWSADGRVVVVSSTEGYCSIIMFEENELGIPYKAEAQSATESVNDSDAKSNTESDDTNIEKQ